VWRYRKWVHLPDGSRKRITGTPATNTKKAAEHAEWLHIQRLLNPTAARQQTREEVVPTVKEYSELFIDAYSAPDKPSSVTSKRQILKAVFRDRQVPRFVGSVSSRAAGRCLRAPLHARIRANPCRDPDRATRRR
jgi:hypothetical protein